MFGAPLADIDAIGIAPAHVEDGRRHQAIVEHHVSLLHQPQGAEGQQVRITGTGADQIDLAAKTGRFAAQLGFQQLLGSLGLAGKDLFRDLALEHLFPEDPPRLQIGEAGLHPGAKALGQLCQLAIGRWNPALQLGAHQARQHRGVTAAGNGDHQGRAIDDGREDHGAQLGRIHHVDRQAQGLGVVGHGLVDLVIVGGRNHQAMPGEMASRIALDPATAAPRLDEGTYLRLDFRRHQGDACAGFGQQHALAQGDIAPPITSTGRPSSLWKSGR